MYTTVPLEAQFFLLSILAGIASAFLYDLLRISRRIVRVNDIVVNAQDVLFFVSAAILVFVASYISNSGEIRWQSFIGLGVGIGLYVFIVRNRFLNLSTVIIKFTVKIASFLIKIILFPFRLILKIFEKPIGVVAWYTGRGVKRVKSAARIQKTRLSLYRKNIKGMFKTNKK